MLAVVLLVVATALVAGQTPEPVPVPRRPEITRLFMFDLCTTSANGSTHDVECGPDETVGLTSLTLSQPANTGASTYYTFDMFDEHTQKFNRPNRRLAQRLSFRVGVGAIVLKYRLRLKNRVPDRYVVQRDTGEICPNSQACNGRALQLPPGSMCNETARYANGVKFQSPEVDFGPDLAIIPTEDMYRGFAPENVICGASNCGVCLGAQATRPRCETERFLMVYPMWQVLEFDGLPIITVRMNVTVILDGVTQDVIELAVNLDTTTDGEPASTFGSNDDNTLSVEVSAQTTVFPFKAQPGFIVAAEKHPLAHKNTVPVTMETCPRSADAQKIYCPPENGYEEALDPNQPEVNPHPDFCQANSRWWFFVEQGVNGWQHGFECNQMGIRPEWYVKNNGNNANLPCTLEVGACVPGFAPTLATGLDVRKFPGFYSQQNEQDRNSKPVVVSGDRVLEWTCDPRAETNRPWALQGNVGFANTHVQNNFLYAQPAADTNVFYEINFLISGELDRVIFVKSAGFLRSPTFTPCILVQGRDGGFTVEVCNTATIASDYGLTLECLDERYGLGTAETTVTVDGNACEAVGPLNIRLVGDIVPGGMFCTVTLFDLATLLAIDVLDQRCEELEPRRQQPLGAGIEGQFGAGPECSWFNFSCWGLEVYMPDWLAFLSLFGFALLGFLVILLILACVVAPCIQRQAFAK